MGDMRNALDFRWKVYRRRELGGPIRGWEDNVGMYSRNRMGWYGLDLSGSGFL
jgi:hypothetical protein